MSKRTSAKAKREAKRKAVDQEEIELKRAEATHPDDLDDLNDDIPWNDDDPNFIPPTAFSGKGTCSIPTAKEVADALKAGTAHRVTVFRDHVLPYPDLYLEVYVTGPPRDQSGFAEMFSRSACSRAKSLEDADLCVFTGGPDVDPSFYGEEAHKETRVNPDRDTSDINDYLVCLEQGIPMLGVCRGAQFLWVMAGGQLFQHVDGHYGDHMILDTKEKKVIDKVSSVHHQMVRPGLTGMEILATTNKSRSRWRNPEVKSIGSNADIEAFFHRDTCALGVQGHPEYSGYNYYTVWVLKQIENYMLINPDTDWINGNRRIKPDILAMRKTALSKGLITRIEAEIN